MLAFPSGNAGKNFNHIHTVVRYQKGGTMNTIMEIDNVEKSYGTAQILNHCSLQLYEGEIYGLLGINGAGKTTLMKMILNLQKIDNGRIYILGKEISEDYRYLQNIGSMIETPSFYEHLNAYELLSMQLSYYGKKADIEKIIQMVGLEEVDKKPISKYSLGMKQRLGIGRAIIHNPKLLILDEPLNGLDPVGISEVRTLFKSLTREGMSILLSSHILEEVRQTSDRIGILSDGSVKEEFSTSQKAAEWGADFERYVIKLMRRNSYESV